VGDEAYGTPAEELDPPFIPYTADNKYLAAAFFVTNVSSMAYLGAAGVLRDEGFRQLAIELGKATVNQGNSILDHSRQLGSSQVSYGRDPLTLATDITDANGKLATLYYSTQTNRTVPAASFISTGPLGNLRQVMAVVTFGYPNRTGGFYPIGMG